MLDGVLAFDRRAVNQVRHISVYRRLPVPGKARKFIDMAR